MKRKYKAAFFMAIAAAIFFSVGVHASVYKRGASGEQIVTLQTKLKRWGYYNGTIDGLYGRETEKAVRHFQKVNSLEQDGVAGTATLAALGMSGKPESSAAAADKDLYLLARMIAAEAEGEPYQGQVAVGAVILNRVAHPSFPNTISSVLYQSGAFSSISNGQFDRVSIKDSARRAAKDAMNGWDPSGGAIYFYNPAKSTSQWIFSRPVLTTIGDHVFAS